MDKLELNSRFYEIIYQIVRKQNMEWLKHIALKEGVSVKETYKRFLPSKRKLRGFLQVQDVQK